MQQGHLRAFAFALLVLAPSAVRAADATADAVLAEDARFWVAYNACDVGALRPFFSDDVEFYHDKGGPTVGLENLIASVKANLCSGASRVRREAVDGTVRLSALRKDGVVYGAVLSGQHRFYVREGDKPERLDGQATFTHLWLLRDGAWKMTRVLSYEHGPVPYVSKRTTAVIPGSALDALAGRYAAPHAGVVQVRRDGATLVLAFADGKTLTVYPESPSLFFAKDRDLTFEFAEADGRRAMRVRENGSVVEEAILER
jgi:hypothetical protein